MSGASKAHAIVAQIMHSPKVPHVSSNGLFFMECTRSETLQVGRPAILDGRSRNTGINISWSGVTAKLREIAIVVMAGLNMLDRIIEHNPIVAKVDSAGIGKIPPQNPTPAASPSCAPFSDFAGTISFSLTQARMLTMK